MPVGEILRVVLIQADDVFIQTGGDVNQRGIGRNHGVRVADEFGGILHRRGVGVEKTVAPPFNQARQQRSGIRISKQYKARIGKMRGKIIEHFADTRFAETAAVGRAEKIYRHIIAQHVLPQKRAHGGGAFSGKDPTKVDRSAAYAARYVAKNIVAAGLARQCQIQVAYAIGVAQPMNITVYTEGTGKLPDEKLAQLVREHFDLRPKGIIEMLKLQRPIYAKTAAYGHFGRNEPEFSWEQTDKAEALRAAAGL